MRKSIIVVSIAALISVGYFIRAYTEKPKVIEVPKERVITKTTYIDKITKLPVYITKEITKFDTDAAVELSKPKLGSLFGVAYGIPADSALSLPIYGISYQKRILGNLFLGASVYTNKTIFLTLAYPF